MIKEVSQRDWGCGPGWRPAERSTVWHDYDGDEIYADVSMESTSEGPVMTDMASHEPGIGTAIVGGTGQGGTGQGGTGVSPVVYRHGDQIGSTREVTGSGGTGVPPVEARRVYTAFGERIHADDSPENLGRYQYAGAWGYQSGLYEDAAAESLPSPLSPAPFIHVGHRWYDPASGRFLQRDPIGIFGGLNVFGYVGNAPLGLVDPQGLGFWDGSNGFHEWLARKLWMNVHNTDTLANMSDAQMYLEGAVGPAVAVGGAYIGATAIMAKGAYSTLYVTMARGGVHFVVGAGSSGVIHYTGAPGYMGAVQGTPGGFPIFALPMRYPNCINPNTLPSNAYNCLTGALRAMMMAW